MQNLVLGIMKKYLLTEMKKYNDMAIEAETATKGAKYEDKAITLQEVLNELVKIEAEVITGKEMEE